MAMGNYKIKFNIDIENILDKTDLTSVTVEAELTEEQACSIDSVEKIALSVNYEAIRRAVAEHLENISKKKLKLNKCDLEEQLKKIVQNTALTEK
jgi:hypothetical protein